MFFFNLFFPFATVGTTLGMLMTTATTLGMLVTMLTLTRCSAKEWEAKKVINSCDIERLVLV